VRLDDNVFAGGPFAPMRSRPDPGARPIKIEAQRDAKDVAQADKRGQNKNSLPSLYPLPLGVAFVCCKRVFFRRRQVVGAGRL
jgi:hypothetical protein